MSFIRRPGEGMLLKHWSEASELWDFGRWPNFVPEELTPAGQLSLACPHCGEFYFDPWMLDGIQFIRFEVNKPVIVNSGHRCRLHNLRIGGAEYSRHLRVAWDISIRKHDPLQIYQAAADYGFSSFGFYGTFLHVDDRPGRRWFSKEGKKLWTPLLG